MPAEAKCVTTHQVRTFSQAGGSSDLYTRELVQLEVKSRTSSLYQGVLTVFTSAQINCTKGETNQVKQV